MLEEDSRLNKGKLLAAMNSMSDAVFISDNDGSFVEFNDAFATFHKFKNKDECPKSLTEYPKFLEVYSEDQVPLSVDQWLVSRALRGESEMNAEYNLLRKDTGETWVGSYNYAPINDDAGKIIGAVVTARDITEIKHAEMALK